MYQFLYYILGIYRWLDNYYNILCSTCWLTDDWSGYSLSSHLVWWPVNSTLLRVIIILYGTSMPCTNLRSFYYFCLFGYNYNLEKIIFRVWKNLEISVLVHISLSNVRSTAVTGYGLYILFHIVRVFFKINSFATWSVTSLAIIILTLPR